MPGVSGTRALPAEPLPVAAVIEGPPVLAIEDATEGGDLTVMTSPGRSGFRRWLLGSTAEKLIREGKTPVLLVPSSEPEAAERRGLLSPVGATGEDGEAGGKR